MPELFACLDAAYSDSTASVACALFAAWDAAVPLRVETVRQGAAPDYQPGAFYKRELPLLLAILGQLERLPDIVIVDGYVWLAGARRPGLGAMLHRALDEQARVVGVAKTRFVGATACVPVIRGTSRNPLYVSSAGIDAAAAADGVRAMHGGHRIPTLLRLVDHAARAALA